MTVDGIAAAPPPQAARASDGQAVCDLIARPYNAHLAELAELKDRSSVVAALAPPRLAAIVRDGVALALDQFGPRLSPKTSAAIAEWLHQHVRLVDQLSEPWSTLSHGSESDLVRGFKTGFASPEAKIGTALGGFAGGIIGTFLALRREDQSFSADLQGYLSEVDRWFTSAAADFDSTVLPQVERDLKPWPYRVRWTVGIALALSVAGAAAWLAR